MLTIDFYPSKDQSVTHLTRKEVLKLNHSYLAKWNKGKVITGLFFSSGTGMELIINTHEHSRILKTQALLSCHQPPIGVDTAALREAQRPHKASLKAV